MKVISIFSKTKNRLIRDYQQLSNNLKIRIVLKGCKQTGKKIGIFGPLLILGKYNVSIGNRVTFAGFIHIWGHGGVTIGNDVMIGSHVAISSVTHDPQKTPLNSCNFGRPVFIEDNVWIGSHAFIDAGVKNGTGSVIAAGAIVVNDVPPGIMVAGVPAKKIKDL
jgi:maltose O-acetyltransferase